MHRFFRRDETYYAIVLIFILMLQSGFIAFGFWLVDYLFNSNIGITPAILCTSFPIIACYVPGSFSRIKPTQCHFSRGGEDALRDQTFHTTKHKL
jgi:hypothetical protein